MLLIYVEYLCEAGNSYASGSGRDVGLLAMETL